MNDPVSGIVHRLDQSQFDKALEILSEEQKANTLTRAQKLLYRLLMIAAYGAITLMAGFICGFVFFPRWLTEVRGHPMFIALFVALSLLIAFTPLLVLMNIALLRKAWRQSRLIRKLNLRAFFDMSWKTQKKKRRWMGVLQALLALFGMLFIIGSFIKSHHRGVWHIAYSLAIGLAMFGAFIIRLWKNKMDIMMNMNDLKEAMMKYREAAAEGKKDFITVPYEKMAQIAQIEASQIARQRAAAIDGMSKAGGTLYTARRSKRFQESAVRLGAEYRLAMEEQIDELLNNPRPENALSSSDGKALVWNFPGLPFALTYAVDDTQLQIDLQSLDESPGEMQRKQTMRKEGTTNA